MSFLLADMATAVAAARSLYLSAARRKDAGLPYGPQAAMAKLFASDAAMRVTTDAVQVLGGYGYVEDFPAERLMREAKVLQIVEGTNQIQRMVIGRSLTRAARWVVRAWRQAGLPGQDWPGPIDSPLSGSKNCRLDVSTASSIGWPGRTLLRAATRAVHSDRPPARGMRLVLVAAAGRASVMLECWTWGRRR